MSTLERAIEIAARAHAGQIDKGGQPYILHPLRVMLAVKGKHERMAAVLHDVVEDTPITIDDLRSEGFPDEVLTAVLALTKTNGESRLSAAARASENPIARAVKLADVTDNMDISRISQPTEEDHARIKVYEEVRTILRSKDTRWSSS
jgi:guanosine-3',5'-bis(diphosphate) 3'-pyrophosphohydrolase